MSGARTAGLCYLAVIAGGLFAQVVVRGSLIVPGDAAATAAAIGQHEQLWRWGLVVHLLYLLPALAVNVLVPELLRPAGAVLSRLAMAFGLVSVAIEGASLINLAIPPAPAAFNAGFGIALVFFAGFCALVGVLILRSGIVPRAIGVLMVVAGACYLVNTLGSLLAPEVALMPLILLPCVVAELSLALWLLVRGHATAASARVRSSVIS